MHTTILKYLEKMLIVLILKNENNYLSKPEGTLEGNLLFGNSPILPTFSLSVGYSFIRSFIWVYISCINVAIFCSKEIGLNTYMNI